jgi:hypothetical protein
MITKRWSLERFSPGSDRMGRLGFFASPPFFFGCFSSFLYPAEFFWEPRRKGKENLEQDFKIGCKHFESLILS